MSLQWLNRSRCEPNLVQPRLLLTRTGNRQMSVVHRVKTTAKNAESHVNSCRIQARG